MKKRYLKQNINLFTLLSSLFILAIILPNLSILIGVLKPVNTTWIHIKTYLLKDYIFNSLILIFWTSIFVIFIGVFSAWLISTYDFPLRNFFKWALILPLAIPPYMAAYTYNGILNYTGVIQTTLRNTFSIQVNQKYFDIMSINGAIFIFTLFLFPYIYIIVQAFLEKQSSSLIENARLLGRSPLDILLHIVIPISRTAIVGGTSLVVLEVLNDYGVVKYFGIPTFSTAIFKTWFAMGDINSAIKLASILMFIIFFLLGLEKLLRGNKQFSYSNTKIKSLKRQKLNKSKAFLACLFCSSIFLLSFFIPTIQLINWSLLTYSKVLNLEFFKIIFNSISVATITSILILIISIIIANYSRLNNTFLAKLYSKITILGYSIPGAVIAISVISFFITIDKNLHWLYLKIDPNLGKLVLSTSIVLLLFAYIIRFLAIGYNSVESGFDKIGKKFFEASKMLGANSLETFLKVDLKMILPSLLSGFILVFVDILKELPLTLILRPFNFNTLSIKAFQYANDEMIHEAAISSLIIIGISVLSIFLLNKIKK